MTHPADSAHCFRELVTPDDRQTVRSIVESTGFFTPPEVDVAVELVDERLAKGGSSGYDFLFAEKEGGAVGYACYGPIACTVGSFDLYWVAVAPAYQGQGVGRALLDGVERRVRSLGGRRLYIETSNRPQYSTTRTFYTRCGFEVAAVLPDFYDRGDDKVIFLKRLDSLSERS